MWLVVTIGYNTYLMPWIFPFPCLFHLKGGHPIFSPHSFSTIYNGKDEGKKARIYTVIFFGIPIEAEIIGYIKRTFKKYKAKNVHNFLRKILSLDQCS